MRWAHQTGAMLLATHIDHRAGEPGAVHRGPAGERWLVASQTSACGEAYQGIAIDERGEVFEVYPQAKPERTTTVRLCAPDCRGGCGREAR